VRSVHERGSKPWRYGIGHQSCLGLLEIGLRDHGRRMTVIRNEHAQTRHHVAGMRTIVLLRGVNLGRNRRLSMADLRALLEDGGYGDVVTHQQSGNVVLTTRRQPAALKRELERRIAAELGLETEVFVRTRDELADVVARNPLRAVADDPSRHLVSFLSGRPTRAARRELEGLAVAPERVAFGGTEIYSWHPEGIRGSKLAAQLGKRQLVTATARNWTTVTKLLALADG
jgi:uncharacterized protein (DUF1697 family)